MIQSVEQNRPKTADESDFSVKFCLMFSEKLVQQVNFVCLCEFIIDLGQYKWDSGFSFAAFSVCIYNIIVFSKNVS